MDKCRCLRLSGQFTASSVFFCLLLRLLKDPDRSGDVGIARSFVPLLCDVSAPFDGSLLLSRLLMGVHVPSLFNRAAKTSACICLLPTCASTSGFSSSGWITGITVCHLLEIAASGVNSAASDGRTRARSTLLRLFYGSSRLQDGLRSLGLFSGCVLFGPVRF
ncbi:hypothetical protein F2Q68_00029772 [Brassica cretica]|uniref:Uncharacterized protein n=1 Tax=Brassica cretica TaxID=69181 RepID=A0A8S9GI19_BRACR|nr:hypothetical protein F2Q68_00029772 [Brassica cretica]